MERSDVFAQLDAEDTKETDSLVAQAQQRSAADDAAVALTGNPAAATVNGQMPLQDSEGIGLYTSKTPDPALAPVAERGLMGDLGSGLARGGVSLLDTTAHAVDTLMPGGSPMARSASDYLTKLPETTPLLRPDVSEAAGTEGAVKKGAMSAAQSFPESMAILPAAAAGAAIGSVIPGIGTAIGGAVGGGAALLGLFGFGQYGKKKEEVVKTLTETRPDLKPEQIEDMAHKNALTTAYSEVGGEGVGDLAAYLIFRSLPGGTALYKGGKTILKELVNPNVVKTIGKGLLKDAPFEVASEVGTSYFQNEADKALGINQTTTKQAMLDSIMPALFLSTGMGTALGGYNAYQRKQAYESLNVGTQEERLKAAQQVAGSLNEATDEKVAGKWMGMAENLIKADQQIPLDFNVADLAANRPDGGPDPALQRNLAIAELRKANLPTRDLIALKNGEALDPSVPFTAATLESRGITAEHIDGLLNDRADEVSSARQRLQDIQDSGKGGPLTKVSLLTVADDSNVLDAEHIRRQTQMRRDTARADAAYQGYDPLAPQSAPVVDDEALRMRDDMQSILKAQQAANTTKILDPETEADWANQERKSLAQRRAANSTGAFAPGQAADTAAKDPRNADILAGWNQDHFTTNEQGETEKVQKDHFATWHDKGGVTRDVGSQYDAHGIAKSNPLGSLLNILENGIDPNYRFDSAPLVSKKGDESAVSALGAAGGAYKDGPFIILSGRGQELKKGGIQTVLVSDEVASTIPALQARFPNIRFTKYSEAQNTLSQDIPAPGPPKYNELNNFDDRAEITGVTPNLLSNKTPEQQVEEATRAAAAPELNAQAAESAASYTEWQKQTAKALKHNETANQTGKLSGRRAAAKQKEAEAAAQAAIEKEAARLEAIAEVNKKTPKYAEAAAAAAQYGETFDAYGTIPETGGNVDETEVQTFERKVEFARQTAREKRIQNLAAEEEAKHDATIEKASKGAPPEVVTAAKKAAKDMTSDGVYAEMEEARKEGVNLENSRTAFSKTTVAAIHFKHGKGLFTKAGKNGIDEFAQSKGYTTANEMLDAWNAVDSKKAVEARTLQEHRDAWENAEEASKQEPADTSFNPEELQEDKIVFVKDEHIGGITEQIENNPRSFNARSFDGPEYSDKQRNHLKAAYAAAWVRPQQNPGESAIAYRRRALADKAAYLDEPIKEQSNGKSTSEKTSESPTQGIPATEGETTQKVLTKEQRGKIRKALSSLSPIQRNAAEMLIQSGKIQVLTQAEAEAMTGVNEDGTQGFVEKGITYLIPENIAPGNLWGLIRHEIGTHVGKLVRKGGDFKSLLKSIHARQQEKGETGDAIRAAYMRVNQDENNDNKSDDERAEEALAYLVEDAPETGLVKRFIQKVKDALRSLGINPGNFTVEDLTALADAAIHQEAGLGRVSHLIDRKGQTVAPKYSKRSWTEDEKAQVMAAAKQFDIPPAKAKKWLKDIDNVMAIILNDDSLDFEATAAGLYSALKNNSDPHYYKSLDFSTLCRKRYVLAATIEKVQMELGRAVTKDNWAAIKMMLKDKGFPVSCGACYVDSKRMEQGKFINAFIDEHPEMDPRTVLTQAGIDNLKRTDPTLYAAFKKKAGSNNSKTTESRVDYFGEIRTFFNHPRLGERRTIAFNKRSGLRWQSWSDFEVPHLMDAMQAVLDMSIVGLKGHAYTKVSDFVDAMGRTGLMINMSLIPKGNGFNADGSLAFDPVEGMDFEKAIAFRKAYPKTAGTIAIGISNEHIAALLADPRIDYVIPYHASGLSKKYAKMYGMGKWNDYTKTQTAAIKDVEKFHAAVGKDIKLLQKFVVDGVIADPKAYTKYAKNKGYLEPDFSEYWSDRRSGKANADLYLKMLEERGVAPKFKEHKYKNGRTLADFTQDPNYWKLLIDRKSFTDDGKNIVQKAVQPVYNMEKITEIYENYEPAPDQADDSTVLEFLKNYQPKKVKRSKAWSTPQQKVSSASTSIPYPDPEVKAPIIFSAFRKGQITLGPLNADIGGGKYDQITNWLKTKGVENVVWDRFNRDALSNRKAETKLKGGQADTVTVSNVLNVIPEVESRAVTIATAMDSLKPGGKAFFSMYAAPKAGDVAGRDAFQVGQKPEAYIPEIEAIFGKGSVTKKGSILIATKLKPVDPNDPKLKAWLRDSVVTDPVYHGTNTAFDAFDKTKLGKNAQSPGAGLGHFFAQDRNESLAYGNVQSFFVRLENPKKMEAADLPKFRNVEEAQVYANRQKLAGHDGLLLTDEGHVIVFDDNQVKSAELNTGEFDPNDKRFNRSKYKPVDTTSANFKRWFKDSKAVDEDGDPVRVYHGTTFGFFAFDKNKANVENDLGSAFYFSDERGDSDHNYAGMGPDLTSRYNTRYERLFDEITEDPEAFGLSANAARITIEKKAEAIAKKELVGKKPQVMELYLSLQNPAILGGMEPTYLNYDLTIDPDELEGFKTEAWDEIKDDEDLTDEDREDYEDQIEERARELFDNNNYDAEPSGEIAAILDSIERQLNRYDEGNFDQVREDVQNAVYFGDNIRADRLIRILKESEGLMYAQDYDNDGGFAGSEIIRQAFEDAGFDGFIDHTVSTKFNMDGVGQTHYLAFQPEQVKSAVSNTGEFDPSNPDIRRSKAFHGSPHNVDKFRSEKIGTGEGAQAYGHGLYFAGSEEVAKWYRDSLSTPNGRAAEFELMGAHPEVYQELYDRMASMDFELGWGDPEESISTIIQSIIIEKLQGKGTGNRHVRETVGPDLYKKIEAVVDKKKGHMYEVDLAPEEDEYLLWDKPLSEQSATVQAALEKKFSLPSFIEDYPMARDFYKNRTKKFQSQEKASDELHSLGIRGIKYLDGSSRAKGEGAFNYVIFNEEDVKIQRKYSKKLGKFDAETEQALRNVGAITDPVTLKDWWTETKKDLKLKIQHYLVDQYAPLKKLGQDVYLQARMAAGQGGALEAMMYFGDLFLDSGVTNVTVGKTKGIIEALQALQGEQHRFLWWVAANRAETLTAEEREQLFKKEDISKIKKLNEGRMPDGKDRTKLYEEVLKDYVRANKNVMDIAEQSELINSETRAQWEHDMYVPFYRAGEDDSRAPGMHSGSGLVRQYAFKKLKGTERKLNNDLLANVLMNWSHLLDASAKNRAAAKALRAGDEMGIAEHIEGKSRKGEKTVFFMGYYDKKLTHGTPYEENGKKMIADGDTTTRVWGEQHYIVKDPLVLESLNALEFSGFKGAAMDALTKTKRMLTMGVTANPAFKIRNLMRDSMTTPALSGASYNPIKNAGQGFRAMREKGQTYASMLAGGGLIRFGSMLEDNSAAHVDKLINAGVKRGDILDTKEKISGFFSGLWDRYNDLGDISEGANRAALYEQLRAKGLSHAEASYQARDLMDFHLRGAGPAARFLAQTVPFFNARAQGLYKLARAGHADPKRLGAVLGATAMASIALMLAYKDDEDWKQREDWDRDTYFWFKVGGRTLRIPKGFEVGAIATLAERGLEVFVSDEMTAKRFGERVLAMLGQTFSFNPTPQLIKPLTDLYADKDSFTGRPIEGPTLEGRLKSDRKTGRTSEIAKAIGSMGDTTGISPVQVDHLIRGYFGWLGTAATVITDIASRPVLGRPEQADMRLRDMFLAGNFVETLPRGSSRYVTEFYDQAKELQQTWNSVRDDIKRGEKVPADAGKIHVQAQQASRAQKLMSVMTERIRAVENNRTMSGAEKRIQIDTLTERRNQLAKKALQRTL